MSLISTRPFLLSSISCSNMAPNTGERAANIALWALNSRPLVHSVTSLKEPESNNDPMCLGSLHSGTLSAAVCDEPDTFTESPSTLTWTWGNKSHLLPTKTDVTGRISISIWATALLPLSKPNINLNLLSVDCCCIREGVLGCVGAQRQTLIQQLHTLIICLSLKNTKLLSLKLFVFSLAKTKNSLYVLESSNLDLKKTTQLRA